MEKTSPPVQAVYGRRMIKRYLFLVFIVGAIPTMPVMGTLLPPPVPTLISPGDSSWIADNTPTLIWSTVGVPVTYTLQYTADSSFGSGVMEVSGLSDTFHTTPAPLADTAFYWRVEAINFSAESSGYQLHPFRFLIDSKKPSVPQLSYPRNYINDLTPTFIWGGVTKGKGAPISYRLQCALDSDFANIVIDTSNLSGTSFTLVDSLSDTTHYFRVEACDLAGNCSGFQGYLTFTTDTTKPGTPSLILPGDSTQINDNTPTLIWSSSTESVVYTVIAAIDSDFIHVILEVNRNDTFYTVISPIADTIIFWKVRAKDYAGNYSSFQLHPFRFEIDARVPGIPVLFSPENLSCTPDSMPTFKWSAVTKFSAPVRYTFQCALDSAFTILVVDTSNLTGTSFSSGIPLSDETYFFRVKACDLAENCSGYQTHPFMFTIDTKPPSIPVLISPSDSSVLDFSIPTFIWGKAIDSVSSVVKYTLQCSIDSTFTQPGLSVSDLTDTTYTVYGGLEEGLYYWRVEAVDGVNNHSGYQTHLFQFNIAIEIRLSLRAIMQGYYNPSNHTTSVTGARVELRDNLEPQNTIHFFPNMLLDSTGRKQKYKCEDLASGYYYLVVKKLNHLAVITASPCHFEIGKLADIDFTVAGVAEGADPMWFESDGLYSLRGGDLDQDGVVFISDYCKLAQNWSTNDSIGDIDDDGVVFISDYSILAQNWAREDYLPEHQKTNPQLTTHNSQLPCATFYIRTWPDSGQSGYYADSTLTLELVVSLTDAEYPFLSYAVGNFLAYDTTVLSLIDYEDNISYEELYESLSDMTNDGVIQYSRMKKIMAGTDSGWVIQNPNAIVPYKLIFKVHPDVDSCLTHLSFTNTSLSDSNWNSIATESRDFPLTILGQGIQEKKLIPCEFEGLTVFPNPGYGKVFIKFALPTQAPVSLKVYDISGILVRTLMDKHLPAGYYTLSWNGADNFGSPAPSGVYFLRFETKKFKSVKKALILR